MNTTRTSPANGNGVYRYPRSRTFSHTVTWQTWSDGDGLLAVDFLLPTAALYPAQDLKSTNTGSHGYRCPRALAQRRTTWVGAVPGADVCTQNPVPDPYPTNNPRYCSEAAPAWTPNFKASSAASRASRGSPHPLAFLELLR